MKLRHLVVGAGVLILVLLTANMLRSLSSDAIGMAVGVLFGVFAGIPTALLMMASSRRRERLDDEEEDRSGERYPRYPQLPGENPRYPQQPPIIVLAAPAAQSTNANRPPALPDGRQNAGPTYIEGTVNRYWTAGGEEDLGRRQTATVGANLQQTVTKGKERW